MNRMPVSPLVMKALELAENRLGIDELSAGSVVMDFQPGWDND